MHQSNLFVTLTYADERLPYNGQVVAKDFSEFVARLRRAQDGRLSFYGCGEYGATTQRPHYHAVLFGVDFLDKYSNTDSTGRAFWRAQSLDTIWGNGHTEIGSVTMASVTYVAGYIRKKVKAADYVRANPYTGELLAPEFARMSLRPAIGKTWIEQNWRDVYPRDFVVVDGVEAKPPRYYDKWMDLNHQDLMEEVRQKRSDEAVELTKYQLNAGQQIATSRMELFARRAGV